MAGQRAARLQVGSAPWIAEERSSAQNIAQDEIEEFTFSARNDFEWLNEHMADIFSENQIHVAEIFKTPGKLRGKTPRTARKANPTGPRVPLADIFSATPKGAPNPFASSSIVDRTPAPRVKIATDPIPQPSPAKVQNVAPSNYVSMVDSGYHGSQELMDVDEGEMDFEEPTQLASPRGNHEHVAFQVSSPVREIQETPARGSPEPTATIDTVRAELDTQYFTANIDKIPSPKSHPGHHESTTPAGSPIQHEVEDSPQESSPVKSSPVKLSSIQPPQVEVKPIQETEVLETADEEASQSASDGSSPIRPVVRKSSLNFASLPAREPMTHKSIGNRISRTSHIDKRNSYYNRTTGGKSLGNIRPEVSDDENDDMDIDDDDDEDDIDIVSQAPRAPAQVEEAATATEHNKTYTQRLQDQISKLGQSQPAPPRLSKSIANSVLPAASVAPMAPSAAPGVITAPQSPEKPKLSSPKTQATPGAFPEDDDDDDWIEPLGTPDNASNMFSPRPALPKSHTADVMEGVSGKTTVSGSEFTMPKTRQHEIRPKSPEKPVVPSKTTSALGHHKSASVPSIPIMTQDEDEMLALKQTMSVSNPSLAPVAEDDDFDFDAPPKSPSRTLRESPLKQVKNKLSSILKTSKGLLASSAAISAEGKSLLSPSSIRLGLHAAPSTSSLEQTSSHTSQPLYPDLSQKIFDVQSQIRPPSPVRLEGRRTRASIEREKAEEKRKEKEAKEAKRVAEQMEKLEKAREQEREKARVFSKEQERIAAMEKQAAELAQKKQRPVETPVPPPVLPISKPTRTSPRRKPVNGTETEERSAADTKADADVDMTEAPSSMPPPSVPRPASAAKGREIKRPMKPTKEPMSKAKQAPTVIRVNMGSQHSQYQPSNSTLSSGLHETLGVTSQQAQPKSKASQATMQRPTPQSLKSSQSSSSRPKALEMAARRKEQEEREAQRKRDAKAEMERKRDEERLQEQQRKLEADKQKEEERRQAAAAREEAKKKAILEKAKQTRAPPPAARSINGQPDYKGSSQSSQPSRPASRLGSLAPKSQEDFGRPVNAPKSTIKRPLQQDGKESKRMRMTEEFEDDMETGGQPSLKGAPVRPSGGFKKVAAGSMLSQAQKPVKPQDPATKNMFPSGYANAPPSATKNLFKSTLTSQHNTLSKPGHPMDTAQFAKGAIPFAPNPAGPAHKTPARPVGGPSAKSAAKSAARSSPRFQNGEQIELPEINTDDEDEYSDDEQKQMFASWTDSPALRRALMDQETLDPMRVFGAPAPLNMEEVFSKSKDRWHKFRARTSSANWSGTDRLTEDDIRKDLAARDKLRREGGWSYDMSRDML
ncbi:hypothetical protein PFICI_04661 [Pestalotiopsis fici W106-1]|uniref:Inner centromere protein ARK-binding domain-containing protein n=1 Tax=Pestalotiopsis fici (strain W106-1 / CGMCC3.15140) TaxID=1229662 RepID=W3X9Q4_PESFW|nr:uncharacterized protein PFICI_04661 [Pestalotiopsis fici W106-1]ETS82785.1 hypothetical protein PFICI_04661 [Pestalotiopsis fici W106-1]